jgi:predicted nucleic acid-binding Zn finger protein
LFASGKSRAVTGVDDTPERAPEAEGDESDAEVEGDESDAEVEGDESDAEVEGDESDAEVAETWQAALDDAGRLTPTVVEGIVSVHGKRGRRAIEAVSEGRVKQYRDFTVVVGYDDEYIVEAGECTCKDAEYNLADDDPTQRCWHSLAVDIAHGLGEVDHHDMWYSEVREFL